MPDSALTAFWRGAHGVSNVLRLTLTVMHELHVQKSASRWWPYLPPGAGAVVWVELRSFLSTVEVKLPMSWPPEELEGLRGSALLLQRAAPLPSEIFDELVSLGGTRIFT